MRAQPILAFLAGLAASVAACGGEPEDQRDTDEPPSCIDGWIADGGTCVPEGCGTGSWGDLDVDGDTIHVDAAAADGGDGSEGTPLRSIQAALDLAGSRGGGLVAVAAGTYAETLVFDTDHAGVQLAGRCMELVALDASVGDDDTPGIGIDALRAEVEVSGLTVTSSSYAGVLVHSGVVALRELGIEGSAYVGLGAHEGSAVPSSVEVERCLLSDNSAAGIVVKDSSTELTLTDTTILDSVPGHSGRDGYGIQAQEGASLTADGCVLSGNTAVGLVAYDPGTEVSLSSTAIEQTLPIASGEGGHGVYVHAGARLTTAACVLAGNTAAGLSAMETGTEVSLVDTTIRDTQPTADGDVGHGVVVGEGAWMRMEGCTLDANTSAGLLASDPGTLADLQDSSITDTATAFGEQSASAIGLVAQLGASVSAAGLSLRGNEGPGMAAVDGDLICTDCALQDNRFAGAVAVDGGVLELSSSSITDTLESADRGGGVGIYARQDLHWAPPVLQVSDSTIADNRAAGIHLRGEGTYQLIGNTITGSVAVPHGATTRCGDGVFAAGLGAWDGAEGLLLQDNAIRDNAGAGLFLDDAGALLQTNAWSDNEPDLLVQGEACLEPQDDWEDAPSREICPPWTEPTCELLFSVNFGITDIAPALAPPAARGLPKLEIQQHALPTPPTPPPTPPRTPPRSAP